MKQFWGLITMEEIPSGAFVCEYLGEVITKKKEILEGPTTTDLAVAIFMI